MYIKYLVIKRYKSYRELTYMEPLSNGINVIIGANGNGKSNFLDAIIFVLTDKYQNLRQEDKKLLLHEEHDDNSEESGIISIEIIIDNKKRDFPIDKDTVSIIKIYNTKENKEEMMVNNKKLLKADIGNLLESAGFSRVNPYYFIQQGKINMMINMNDYEYFELFSEVIGSKTYEDKKMESLKLLDESNECKNKIIKQKDEINDYIEKLNNQCEDLKEFVKLEEKRKAYDAFLINEKIMEIQVNCEFLEERKKEKIMNMEEISKKQNRIKNKINMNLNEIEKLNKFSLSLKNKIEKCNEEINNVEKFKFQYESNLRFIKDSKNNLENNIENLERELRKINDEKEKSENDLKNIEKKIKSLDKEIEKCEKNYNQAKNSSDYLLLKSPSERNKFINTEIQKLNSSKKFIDDNIIDIEKQINENKEKIKENGRQLEEYENKFTSITKKILELNNKLIESKNKRKEIINNIKRNDIESNEIKEDINQLTDQINKLKLSFPSFEIFNSVSKIINQKIQGVYGLLLDLFEINQKAKNAVDLILKDKLYTIICDTLETANKILEINKKNQGPVINIIPLEFIESNVKSVEQIKLSQIPSLSQNNMNENFRNQSQKTQLTGAKYLIDFIEINPDFINKYPEIPTSKLKNILIKNFSMCLLVKNYETGMKYAKELNLTCITSENEIINRGGYITKVGYYDFEKQRCNLYEKFCESNRNIFLLNEKKDELSIIKNNFNNDDNDIVREQQELFKEKNNLNSIIEEISKNKNVLQNEIANCSQMITYQNNIMEKLLSNKKEIQQNIDIYNQIQEGNLELNSHTGNKLLGEIQKNEKKIYEMTKSRNELSSQKIELQSRLNNYLNKRKLELESQINQLQIISLNQNDSNLNEKENSNNIEISNSEINSYKEAIKKWSKEIKIIQSKIEQYNDEIIKSNDLNNTLNSQLNNHEGELKKIILSLNDKLEKKNQLLEQLGKIGNVSNEETEKLKKIKENSQKAFANESGINIQQQELKNEQILSPIYQLLEKINLKMKKFDKINRFALDDYTKFITKKEEIEEKLKDLTEKEKEILEIIKLLDEKKDNSLNTTFEKVNSSFEIFFKELIPNGKATLQLSIENKSIHINVNFIGNIEKSQAMHQLSGGQKTAVAISLIFALSQIDPPPFYILDEIDAALDPNLRVNFNNLLRKLSDDKQFIISTFKPELLDNADNIYQVKFANKTSNIVKMDKDEAKKFLMDTF